MTCKLVVGGDACIAHTHESWYVTKKSPNSTRSRENYGAGDRARTGTSLTSRDFKSRASANSATPANRLLYTTTNAGPRQEKITRREDAGGENVKFT